MFTTTKTVRALTTLFEDALAKGQNEVTLTIKATGDKVGITLCSHAFVAKSLQEVEYFLMDCRFPWAGYSRIEDVANLLNNWEAHIREEADERARLHDYFVQSKQNGTFDADWYSDWYKDVYGFRPH